jgi:phosphatidylserine/phosphatidylglycerophosphate/cardiolipin synthase-like enzyme
MSHLKGMVLDKREVVLGSSNFDWPSSDRLPEYIAFVSEPGLLASFRERILAPDLAQSDVLVRAGPARRSRTGPSARWRYTGAWRWSCGGEYGHFQPNGHPGA